MPAPAAPPTKAPAAKAPAATPDQGPVLPGGIDPSQLSKDMAVSSIMGASVGVAARRLTSDALYGAGLCFAGLQCLSYFGLITIHWNVIADAVSKAADQNEDGKLDMEDAKIFWRRCMAFASRGLPNAAGFTSGFFFGYKFLA